MKAAAIGWFLGGAGASIFLYSLLMAAANGIATELGKPIFPEGQFTFPRHESGDLLSEHLVSGLIVTPLSLFIAFTAPISPIGGRHRSAFCWGFASPFLLMGLSFLNDGVVHIKESLRQGLQPA